MLADPSRLKAVALLFHNNKTGCVRFVYQDQLDAGWEEKNPDFVRVGVLCE